MITSVYLMIEKETIEKGEEMKLEILKGKLDTCWRIVDGVEIERERDKQIAFSPFPENIGTALVLVLPFTLQS